jgi:hypothetical protein
MWGELESRGIKCLILLKAIILSGVKMREIEIAGG